MQTLKTNEFNTQYPDFAFENTEGFVTFDDTIATWALTKKQSKVDFLHEKNIHDLKITNGKTLKKEQQRKQAEAKLANDLNKKREDYNMVLSGADNSIILNPADDRFDVIYKVGKEERTRNISPEVALSLLDKTQRKYLLAGKRKTFKIGEYDFRAVIVGGAKRPGVKN